MYTGSVSFSYRRALYICYARGKFFAASTKPFFFFHIKTDIQRITVETFLSVGVPSSFLDTHSPACIISVNPC